MVHINRYVTSTLKLFSVLFFALSLSACFDFSTVVSVRPDGTGTVTERFLISKASFKEMHAPSEGDQKGKPAEMPDKAELEKSARKLGEGVRLLSVSPLVTKSHEGYEALYAFTDINKLQISRNPDVAGSADTSSGTETRKQKKQYVRFRLTEGTPSRLLISLDQEQNIPSAGSSSATSPAAISEQGEMMTNIMKEFFKGMHVFLAVDIDGTLLGTNATYRTDKRVTLMDVDFDKLMANSRQFAAFTALPPDSSPETMQKILEKIPGIKVESKTKIDITFQ
ncbi:MAG: hypothetical protein HGA72_01035 [Chlorobiaceae bacterium]|jgi:hypothetical protein|nr:hypothetical protein [Chlorobiaceae bacterium]NTW62626.1 hypothetical protein [Chlorobiaceae bacterium]